MPIRDYERPPGYLFFSQGGKVHQRPRSILDMNYSHTVARGARQAKTPGRQLRKDLLGE